MPRKLHPRSLPLTLLLALTLPAAAQEIVAKPNKPAGVYAPGETITWTIELKPDPAKPVTDVKYLLKAGGLKPVKDGTLDLSAGPATVEASSDTPNTLLLEIKAKAADKEIKSLAGAAVAPEKIEPSAQRPADFDAFWQAKIDHLNTIPPNPQVTPGDSGKPNVDYFKVELDNVNNTKVRAQLAKPKKEGKFPAMLLVQYAGVYPLKKEWAVHRAQQGWLALNVMAHDLPIDQPEDFYKQAASTTLKDYMAIGIESRDTSYFLRMYLACYRAADYLTQHPDWDGRVLVVTGTSQGGQQAIVTAALHPKVTALMANVPAGADGTGPLVGRAAGFPYWQNNGRWRKKEAQAMETGRYFDVVNFAPRVKCPALVGLGLIDETCPPAGVFAAANLFQGPKELVVMPESDHQGRKNTQAPYYKRFEAWNQALKRHEPVPPK